MQRREASRRGAPPHSGASFMVPISSAVAASVGASLLSASALARLAQLAKLPICAGAAERVGQAATPQTPDPITQLLTLAASLPRMHVSV